MRFLCALAALAAAQPTLLWAQAEYRVYGDHPRLFLDADRARRLERDAERETRRWLRLRELVADGAPMPERPAAEALVWRIAHDEAAGRSAVDWALAAAEDGFAAPGALRLGALVYDWAQDRLDEAQRDRLAAGLARGAEAATALSGADVSRIREGVLAAIATAGRWGGSEAALEVLLETQWKAEIVPLLEGGGIVDRGQDLAAVLEICHVVRTNLERDLWAESPAPFRHLPWPRILSYLPESRPTGEGRVRLRAPASDDPLEPVWGRIAEMMLVGYDTTSREFQFLQGWLRNDSYTLTGPLGALYEFLWINPYLPGLSPTSGPTLAYDPVRGRLFARRSWDDGDLRLAYYDGRVRLYEGGREKTVEPGGGFETVVFPDVAVVVGSPPGRLEAVVERGRETYGPLFYFVGLAEGFRYPIRIGKHPEQTYTAGRGGVVELRNDPEAKRPALEYGDKIRLQVREGSPPPRGPVPTLGPRR